MKSSNSSTCLACMCVQSENGKVFQPCTHSRKQIEFMDTHMICMWAKTVKSSNPSTCSCVCVQSENGKVLSHTTHVFAKKTIKSTSYYKKNTSHISSENDKVLSHIHMHHVFLLIAKTIKFSSHRHTHTSPISQTKKTGRVPFIQNEISTCPLFCENNKVLKNQNRAHILTTSLSTERYQL